VAEPSTLFEDLRSSASKRRSHWSTPDFSLPSVVQSDLPRQNSEHFYTGFGYIVTGFMESIRRSEIYHNLLARLEANFCYGL
jgi:hypothetical protein